MGLVTGANQGIGAATAQALAAQGAAVLLACLRLDPAKHADGAACPAAIASPVRHAAQPDDAAEVIVLLACHQARHITGQIIHMA